MSSAKREFRRMLDELVPEGVVDAAFVLRCHDREQSCMRLVRGQSLLSEQAAHIIVMSYDTDTYAEAVRARCMVDRMQWTKVGIVTHQYHHYRAYLTFAKALEHSKAQLYTYPIRLAYPALLHEEDGKVEQYAKKGHSYTYEEGIVCLYGLITDHV